MSDKRVSEMTDAEIRELATRQVEDAIAQRGHMDAATRELLAAIRDAMALPEPRQREDATDAVYALLDGLLDGDGTMSLTDEAAWLRKEVARIKNGGGTADLARRTIAELITAERPTAAHCPGCGCISEEDCNLCPTPCSGCEHWESRRTTGTERKD